MRIVGETSGERGRIWRTIVEGCLKASFRYFWKILKKSIGEVVNENISVAAV